MKKLFLLILFLTVVVSGVAQIKKTAKPNFIHLLNGYSMSREAAIDAAAWQIVGTNGLVIEFESGASQGFAADPKLKSSYAWFREQTFNGRLFMLAYVKKGTKVKERVALQEQAQDSDILLITVPLGNRPSDSWYAANFVAKVRDEKDILDVITMVATFDPSKGRF